MGWLEDAIAFFSPKWAAERAAYRQAQRLAEGYEAGTHSRIGSDNAVGGRADYHLDVTGDRREIVERARQLERNNTVACGLLDRAVDNVVGTGFGLKPLTNSEQFNAKAKELWDDWCAYECDARGMHTFNELLALAYRHWLRDGDVGFIMLSSGALQGIESDQLTNPGGTFLPMPTGDDGSRWIDGVKVDRIGRPVSFNIVTNPDPLWVSVQQQSATEIPAKWFAYLTRHQRLGQTRGISAFSTNMWLLEQIERSVEATVVAQRMAACVGLYIKRREKLRGLGTSSAGRRQISMEPAFIAELDPGEDIGQLNPTQPATNYSEFMSLMGRLVGIPFGLPLELSFMDYSQTNYSSARSSMLAAQRVFKCHQGMLARFASRIYMWKVMNWIREGKLRANPDAKEHKWLMSGWAWVDPQKEIQADLMAIDAGLKTATQVVEERGGVFADNVKIRGEEIKMLEAANIPVVAASGTREAAPEPPPAPAPSPGSPGSQSQDKEQ